MQRASVKLLLKENKINELGQMPIYLRTTVKRKSSYSSTGYWIQPKHWDPALEQVKPALSTHEEINLDITNQKKSILQSLIDASIKGQSISAKALKERDKKKLHDIFCFADEFIKQARGNRAPNTTKNYEKHLAKLKEYAGTTLTFKEVDADFLYNFEDYLRNGGVKSRSDNPNNYIEAIIKTLRTFFNAAIKRGVTDNYPFTQYEMPKTSGGNKAYLSLEEVRKLHAFAMETTHPTFSQVAVYFLFACYTGLRFSDWKDFGEIHIKKDSISLKATKNKAWIAVPFHQGHKEIFQRMKEVQLTIGEPTFNRRLKDMTKVLKIKKSLSTHCGRKTFAVTLCLERGVSAETAAKLMGITLAVFEKNYSVITPEKISLETSKAWKGLF